MHQISTFLNECHHLKRFVYCFCRWLPSSLLSLVGVGRRVLVLWALGESRRSPLGVVVDLHSREVVDGAAQGGAANWASAQSR